jgi:hypothetical protein
MTTNTEKMAAALMSIDLNPEEALIYAQKLVSEGYTDVNRLYCKFYKKKRCSDKILKVQDEANICIRHKRTSVNGRRFEVFWFYREFLYSSNFASW